MKGFVLKSHYIQTGERAQVVTKAVPGSKVFGAVTLNHSVGGLNPVAVEIAGRSGCKIVWMPTVDARARRGGHLAAAVVCDRRVRRPRRTRAALPRADREAPHDSCDRSPRTP